MFRHCRDNSAETLDFVVIGAGEINEPGEAELRSVIWTLEEDQVTVVQASAEHHFLLYCKGEVHIEGKIVSNLLMN